MNRSRDFVSVYAAKKVNSNVTGTSDERRRKKTLRCHMTLDTHDATCAQRMQALIREGRSILHSIQSIDVDTLAGSPRPPLPPRPCPTPPPRSHVQDQAPFRRDYATSLEHTVERLLRAQSEDREIFRASAQCVFAKHVAGRVVTALFDHVKGAKVDALKTWYDTGNIQTRTGPCHWRLDPRMIRDEKGFVPKQCCMRCVMPMYIYLYVHMATVIEEHACIS